VVDDALTPPGNQHRRRASRKKFPKPLWTRSHHKPTDVLGRIAAQTAKQVILQKVREAERDTIFNEYNGRVGELVTVIVKRAEGPT